MTETSTHQTSDAALQAATRAARLAAVQALYEVDVTGAAPDEVVIEFLGRRWRDLADDENAGPPDQAKFKRLFRGVVEHRGDLDRMVAGALAEGRDVERLDILLKSLLRAGAFELMHLTDVPAKVIVSEYVGLAHAFFSEGEPGLVNGVLDKLARVLRPDQIGNG